MQPSSCNPGLPKQYDKKSIYTGQIICPIRKPLLLFNYSIQKPIRRAILLPSLSVALTSTYTIPFCLPVACTVS